MDAKGWFIKKLSGKAPTTDYREEEWKQAREKAYHKQKLLEEARIGREKAKKSTGGGLGGFFGEGIKTLGQNLAAGAGETSLGGFGGGLDHGIGGGGGKRGGGLGFNPITGESYGGSKHKHHKHHGGRKHSKSSGKTITIHLG